MIIKEKKKVKFINVSQIEIRKGEGRHPFKCVTIFNNGSEWVIRMPLLSKLCESVGICEDKKYPQGLGRNMFLLANLIKIYKPYLEKNGFKLNEEDYNKAIKHKINSEIKIINKIEAKK